MFLDFMCKFNEIAAETPNGTGDINWEMVNGI